ncbi:HIRAN domain-containing protein [Microbacterium lacus]|uniref:HIRAN domain-containing protein n=1 Tax=Microbacterium lacus TaxID=415217 RepID=A0ABN2H332_9MICO
MATQALDRDQLDLTASRKTLILVWQNPVTRLFVKVGQLDALPGGRFAFQYLPGAWNDPAFVPLLEYPDRDTAYVSDEVPAFFANRILSVDRPHYDRYLSWLGIEDLSPDEVPFEVLARTGGGRATDTFHVVELPLAKADRFTSRFFVSGVRYFADSDAAIATLKNGATLRLELDEGNEVNPKAVLVNTIDGQKFGYVPDWLCSDVHARAKDGWSVTAVAERVNPDAPAHVRVLCRLEARRG